MYTKAAGLAAKSCLPGSVAAFRMPAATALLARMPRVLLDDLYAGPCRLVADEAKKLREGPSVKHAVDLARLLGPIPDTEQLLDVKDAALFSDGIDDLPADAVILAPHPSGLAFLAALALQCLPVSEVPSASVTQRLAVEEPDDARSTEDGEVGEA